MGLQVAAGFTYSYHVDELGAKLATSYYALRDLAQHCSWETLRIAQIHSQILEKLTNQKVVLRIIVNYSHITRGNQNQYNLPQHKLTLFEKQCMYIFFNKM